ncbi:MAG: hypothetical protein GY856_11440, partial [bacterium]|nr:hypothetical protein [bacterium]
MNHRFSHPWHRSTLALLLGLAAVLGTTAIAGDAPEQDSTDPATLPDGPDFKEVLSLSRVGSPRISPDGGAIAYTVRTADWVDNRYDTEIWLAPQGEEPFPLTRTAGQSSTNPQWSPDGKWLAFLADRGEGRQIHLIRPRGGEARPLTAVEDGVDTYRWSPDGSRMAVAMTEPQDESDKKREELYG